MRLFLSSQDFGNHSEALIELVGDNTKAAFINNAKDDWNIEDRSEKTEEKKHAFHQLGFEIHELDLRSYFKKKDQLEKELKDYGLVWAAGGNTFILRRAMKASGLDEILKSRLADDTLAYGGSSAGSIVATPSLHGTELGDDPSVIPEHYEKEIIWEGLGLVPFHIVPHYKSDWFGKESEQMVRYLEANNHKFKTLEDGQVIVVENNEIEFLR
jgi:dipeptidase E